MKSCNDIRILIDEAHKPDVLSFEVTAHIGQCGGCEHFASERAALRKLVASSARVSVPMNFDAMLKSRLEEAKTRRTLWLLSPPGYARLGAATAGLVVMFFAAQYAGLFSNQPRRTEPTVAQESASGAPTVIEAPGVVRGLPPVTISRPGQEPGPVILVNHPSKVRRAGGALGERVVPEGYLTAEDGGVVLVRSEIGGPDVSMPTVSVGAQPLVYVSAGQRTTRTVGTSF